MSSAARLKTLIKPILSRNPDLMLAGKDTLWLRPVEHMGRQIHFRRGPADYFSLQWHLSALFVPALWVAPHIGSFYDRIGRSVMHCESRSHLWLPAGDEGHLYRSEAPLFHAGTGLWIYDDATLQEDLVHQIEALLRLLRSLDTLEKCIAFLRLPIRLPMNQIEHWTMLMDLAVGNVDAAREFWRGVRHRHRAPSHEDPTDFFGRIAWRWLELDAPLMAGDRAALAILLSRWETENVQRLSLGEAWNLVPFPLERALADQPPERTESPRQEGGL